MTFRDLCHHPNIQRMTANGVGFEAENLRREHFRISTV